MGRKPRLELAAALAHLRRSDAAMGPLIDRLPAPRLARRGSAFFHLARSIIYQQVSGRSAAAVFRRFRDLYGGNFPAPHEVLATSPGRLRGAGLSRQKATYLRNLARGFVDGAIRPRRFARMSDAEISGTLVEIKGVGQWTADMFLIFGLGRPDVLPLGDLGVRRGMSRHFSLTALPGPEEMTALAADWRPFRSVASWYLWRLSEE